MIHVSIDLSHASPDEVLAFYALPGVGRALDAFAHDSSPAGVRLHLAVQPTPEEERRLSPPLADAGLGAVARVM